jgi:putative PEP-CTERM system TPR-repeat lipoprotein
MDPKHMGTAKRLGAVLVAATLLSGCEFLMSSEARIERAEQSMAKGDMSAAIVDLKNVLEKDADDARARLLLAKAQLQLGDVTAAAIDFGRVDAKAVPPEEYEPLLWRIRYAERKFKEMIQALAAPRPGLPDGERLVLLARAYSAEGEGTKARAALEEAVQKDPTNDDAIAALAIGRASQGDSDEAFELVEAAVKARPDSAVLHRVLGQLQAGSGRLPEGEAALRRAFELSSAKADLPGYLGTAAPLLDVLLAQGKMDEASKVVAQLTKDAPNAGLTLLARGRVAAAKRDFGPALEDLTRLLNADPENVQLRVLIGSINLEQRNFEQATMNLQRALAADPDNVQARRLLAQVQLLQGRADRAQETLQAATREGEPVSPDLLLLQARAALGAGDQARAREVLAKLEQQGVPTEAVRLDLAAAYIQVGQPDRAVALLSAGEGGDEARREQLRAVAVASKDRAAGVRELKAYAEKHAGDGAAVRFAALTLGALGEVPVATKLLEQRIAADPKDVDTLSALAQIQARAGQLDAAQATLARVLALKPTAEVRIASAQLAAARGREDEALQILEEARKADPKAVAPRTLLARAYFARNNLDAARKLADELIALDPAKPEPRLLSAGVALKQKDEARALSDVNEAVRIAPQAAGAWLGKGEIHEVLKQYDEARTAYRRAQALAPDSPLPGTSMARLEVASGDTSAALREARAMQDKPAQRVAGLRLEADVLTRLGRHEDAVRALEQMQKAEPTEPGAISLYGALARATKPNPEQVLVDWLKEHPRAEAARTVLADHYTRMGQKDRAIAEYEKGIEFAPRAALMLNNLAWMYHEKKDARALETARRAYAAAPRSPAIADTLAVILFEKGEREEALRLMREASAADPRNADVQFHYADALVKVGSAGEAKQVAEKFLQTNPKAEERVRFERFLK